MARRRNKGQEKQIVARRVGVLLDLARDEALGPDADLADRYADLTIRLARRYQFRLRPDQKVQICRKCRAYRTAATSRVRLQKGRITTTCLRCGSVHRRPLE